MASMVKMLDQCANAGLKSYAASPRRLHRLQIGHQLVELRRAQDKLENRLLAESLSGPEYFDDEQSTTVETPRAIAPHCGDRRL